MTTDPADRLTRAAARLRESDDPFRRAVADWLDAEAEEVRQTASESVYGPGISEFLLGDFGDGALKSPSLKVADVVLSEAFQQAARDLAAIDPDAGRKEAARDRGIVDWCGGDLAAKPLPTEEGP